MKSVEVKSVTFYQTVRLNSKEEKTVSPSIGAHHRKTQMVFAEDKIFIRDPSWVKHDLDCVYVIGLHNVRHFSVKKEDFLDSEYAEVFKAFGKNKKSEKKG